MRFPSTACMHVAIDDGASQAPLFFCLFLQAGIFGLISSTLEHLRGQGPYFRRIASSCTWLLGIGTDSLSKTIWVVVEIPRFPTVQLIKSLVVLRVLRCALELKSCQCLASLLRGKGMPKGKGMDKGQSKLCKLLLCCFQRNPG